MYWTKQLMTALPGRRHVRVHLGLDRAVEVGVGAVPAVLGVVEGALEVLHRGPDVREASVLVGPVAEGRVARHAVQREVHLGRGALEAEALDRLDEVGRQLARLDELEERAPRIERRDDDRRVELGAVLEGHARGPPVAGDDVLHGRVQPDLRPERLRRLGQDLREAAVAALVERPGAHLAVVLTEDVIQEHEAGTLGIRADFRADDGG